MAEPTGLASRALMGLSWNYLGTLVRIGATFVSQIVLARLIGPEQVGLYGYAYLTVSMLALVVQMGLQAALVQAPSLNDEAIAIARTRLLVSGAVGAVGVYLLADTIAAGIFSDARAGDVLRAMSPTLLVGTASACAMALLSRDLDFKHVQLASLGSYLVGYLVVGVAAATAGWGVWSLVLAWHVQTILACVMLHRYSRRRPVLANPLRRLPIARFGIVVWATDMLNWVIDNGPHVAIGRWMGAASLGQYTIANNLVKVPADHLIRNLQSVLFPLASRAQGNDAGLRRAYLTVLSGVALVAFPIFTFVALMAHPIVTLLLGPKWEAAAPVLAPLALAMIGHVAEGLCGPILSGRGEPRVELRVKAVTLAGMLIALALATSWSPAAVGWGVAGVFLFRWIWMNAEIMTRLGVSWQALSGAMLGPLMLAAICAAVVGGWNYWDASMPQRHLAPIWLLAGASGCAACAALATIFAMPRLVLGDHLLVLLDSALKQRPTIADMPGLKRVAAVAARSSI